MGQDFFKFLPSEIILNILSRLPTETTMSCKCVCKPWLDLLSTPEFVRSHLSKPAPRLAVNVFETHSYKIFELVDEHRWRTVFNLDLPFHWLLHSAANGVLFLGGMVTQPLILCNPFTRECIRLPPPSLRQPCSKFFPWHCADMETYGFGVSRVSREYKVVRIFVECKLPYCCQVYTVGTGSWRRIAIGRLKYVEYARGAFLNGNLHWLAKEGSSRRISCLDLETELFSSFSPPPTPPRLDDDDGRLKFNKNVSVLGDCLCVCDITVDENADYEIEIWLMKEYGDEESWTKEFVIHKANFPDDYVDDLCPIKVFENGDILMDWGGVSLLYYSSKTKGTRDVDVSGTKRDFMCSTAVYAPSFLPLKAFAMENVSSF